MLKSDVPLLVVSRCGSWIEVPRNWHLQLELIRRTCFRCRRRCKWIGVAALVVCPGVLKAGRIRDRDVKHKRLVQLRLIQEVTPLGVVENSIRSPHTGLRTRAEWQPCKSHSRSQIVPIFAVGRWWDARIAGYHETDRSIGEQRGFHSGPIRDDLVVAIPNSEVRLVPQTQV